jgi:hypothetical protein
MEDLERDGAGNVIIQYALADWIGGVIAEDFVALRLLLARPGEAQAEASLDLQMRMTKDQTTALRNSLQELLDHIPPRPISN